MRCEKSEKSDSSDSSQVGLRLAGLAGLAFAHVTCHKSGDGDDGVRQQMKPRIERRSLHLHLSAPTLQLPRGSGQPAQTGSAHFGSETHRFLSGGG